MNVHLKNLSMEFGSVKAVDNFTATFKSGELVALLGPSGCGKSTTLMMLAGLYKPTGGKVFFEDEDVTNVDAERRGIGMVFQNYALYPHMTVAKNILFPLKMQKVKKPEATTRMMEIAKLVQIENLLDRKPGQLSGGQQQRVAIARALVKRPKLLLLDEPLSNLDARLRLEMREEMRRIQLEVGITAIFVTHDQEEAMSISDKIILMKDGVLQQESKPQEMYSKPCNQFVASFVGSPLMNLLSGPFSDALRQKINIQDNLTLGIRPEKFYLADSAKAVFSGEVIHIETVGRDTLVRIKSKECDNNIRALIDPEADIKKGDICHLGIKPDSVHFFSKETGERVEAQ